MRIRVTLDSPGRPGSPAGPRCVELLVDAPSATPFGDLRESLARAGGLDDHADSLSFIAAGASIPRAAVVGEPPLLEGVLIHVARSAEAGVAHPGPRPPEPGLLALQIVSGPGAGRSVPLTTGSHVLGRSHTCSIRLEDQSISRFHLELGVSADGVTIRDLEATNPSLVDGRAIAPDATLALGQRLRLGSCTVMVRRPDVTAAATTTADGIVKVHRPPRFGALPGGASITFPEAPGKPDGLRVPLVAALAPVVGAAVVSVVMRSPTMLLFALLSPLMLLGQWLSDRRQGRVSHRRAVADHEKVVRALRDEVARALRDEAAARHAQAPDLAVLASVARVPEARLWERRPEDHDHLVLRVGLGRETADLRLAGAVPTDLVAPTVDDVPVTLALATIGVLGVSGPRPRVLAQAASLVLQLATWHSPRELQLVLVTNSSTPEADWGWASRLPQAQPMVDSRIASVLSARGDSVSPLVAELDAIVRRRQDAVERSGVVRQPRIVVLLDGAHDLRRAAGMASLLRHGPEVGVHFICLDEQGERLPAEATAHVELGSSGAARATVRGRDRRTGDLVPDLPTRSWVEQVARSLAPLRDGTPDDAAILPGRIGFRELHVNGPLALDPADPAALAAHWSDRRRPRHLLLGMGAAGPYAVDLRSAGPHALVAGTTGAGKSELLQTLVAGLAVAYHPEELSLVLIDYKGGSAFTECAALPHTAGLVTDLDEQLGARALTSLSAELKRRERILADWGAKDLDSYLREPGAPVIPRLVLVVDEFKVLAEELPEFVDGLVRLAAVGRSLGIHLVLATQRPAGIISSDMRANIGLRICLRVRDRGDSVDVVESPDAWTISDRSPGRALVRTAGLDLEMVQTAYVGGPMEAADDPAHSTPMVWQLSWSDLYAPAPRRPRPDAGAAGPTRRSELAAIVSAARAAAHALGAEGAGSPWLPPLPDRLPAAALGRDPTATDSIALGLVDRPSDQRQDPYAWRWREGHLGLMGGARTGRTTTLRLIALQLADSHSPTEVRLHVIEGAAGRLRHLESLPHVGSVVDMADSRRARRLIRRLLDEVVAYAGGARPGARAGARTGARTVLLIDDWEALEDAFQSVDHGTPTDELLRLIRDGRAAGVTVVVTGGRVLAGGRLSPLLEQRLVLALADPLDLALAGVPTSRLPAHRGPGRAVDPGDGSEVQLAFAGTSPEVDDQDHAVAMAATVLTLEYAALPPEARPWRIQPLPAVVKLSDLPAPSPTLLAVGLGGDDLVPVGFDPSRDQRRVLVAGPARSGRSTALVTLARQLHHAGRPLAVIPGRGSPLSRLDGIPGIRLFGAADSDAFIALRRGTPELAVVIDDAEALEGTPIEGPVLEAVRLVDAAGGFVAAGVDIHRGATLYRGLVPELARDATGLLLGACTPADGELFRVRVDDMGPHRPGLAALISEGRATPLQVALPDDVPDGVPSVAAPASDRR